MKPNQLIIPVICLATIAASADCSYGQAPPMEGELQARSRRMLKLQAHIHGKIGKLHAAAKMSGGKITGKLHKRQARKLADAQMPLAIEADKIAAMLRADGAAVAFPEVFEVLRDDMKTVERRLRKLDVGKNTILIEDDILATLRELLHGLRK